MYQFPKLDNVLTLEDRIDSLIAMAILLDYKVLSYDENGKNVQYWYLELSKPHDINFILCVVYYKNSFWRLDLEAWGIVKDLYVDGPKDSLIDDFFKKLIDKI